MAKGGQQSSSAFERSLRLGFVSLALLSCLALWGVPAHAETTLIGNFPPTSSASDDFIYAQNEKLAQSFLTGASSRKLSSVTIRLTSNYLNATVAVCDDNPGFGPSSTCTQLPTRTAMTGLGAFYYRYSEWALANQKTLTGGGVKYWVEVTNAGTTDMTLTSAANFSETGEGLWPDLPLPLTGTLAYWAGSWTLFDQVASPDWGTTFPVMLLDVKYTTQDAVELFDFTAASSADGTLISWQTGSEQDNAGFNIWRSDSENGDYVRVTDSLIPAEGGAGQGATYSYLDATAVPGVTYFYKLEDVDTAGVSTFHGPVQVSGEAVVEPAISLVAPDAGARVRYGRRPRFEWSSETSTRFQIRFSRAADPAAPWLGLPGTKSRSTRSGSWTSKSFYVPTAAEWQRVRQMGWRGGKVYWWVVGTDDAGNLVATEARELRVR